MNPKMIDFQAKCHVFLKLSSIALHSCIAYRHTRTLTDRQKSTLATSHHIRDTDKTYRYTPYTDTNTKRNTHTHTHRHTQTHTDTDTHTKTHTYERKKEKTQLLDVLCPFD